MSFYAIFILTAHLSFAAPAAPAVSPKFGSSALQGVMTGLEWSTYLVAILTGLLILNGILDFVLTNVAFYIGELFKWNIFLNPAIMGVVQEGWKVTRDIANAFFILVLLWIAFTIIFNVENLGGKRLLARLIIIALLVNFSLVMVSTVFSFANILARPFQEALGTSDIVGLMMGKTKLHTVTDQIAAADLEQIDSYAKQQNQIRQIERGLPEALLSPNEANAVGPVVAGAAAAGGCGLGALAAGALTLGFGAPVGCAIGSAALGVAAQTLSFVVSAGITAAAGAVLYKAIINLAVGNIFIIITVFAFLAAGITLMARLVAMVFLAVLAPFAFLLHAVPGGDKYWNMWLQSLFKWAFFAPAFYFLMWLSFLVLDQMEKSIPQVGQFQANIPAIFNLMIFLGFLIGSIIIARKMGITVADSFINWGKKIGWGAVAGAGGFALGALRGAAMPRIGALSGQLEERVGKIESPALRRALSLPATGLRKVTAAGRKEVAEREKGIKDMTAAEIKRAFGQNAFLTVADQMAAIRRLQEMQELGADESIKGYTKAEQPEIVRRIKNLTKSSGGDWKSLVRTNPDFTEESDYSKEQIAEARKDAATALGKSENEVSGKDAAIWKTMKEMKTQHIDKNFDAGSLKNATVKELALAAWRGEHWGALGRVNPGAIKEINEHLNITPEQARAKAEEARAKGDTVLAESWERAPERVQKIIENMDTGQYNYYKTTPAQTLGLRLPADHKVPLRVLESDIGTAARNAKELADRYNSMPAGRAKTHTFNRVQQALADYDVASKKIKGREEEFRLAGKEFPPITIAARPAEPLPPRPAGGTGPGPAGEL